MSIPETYKTLAGLAGLALACTLAPVGNLSAVTIAYEGFDIPVGEIDNTMGTTSYGWYTLAGVLKFPWDSYNDSTFEAYHGVAEGSLEYPGVPTVGNSFVFTDEIFDFGGKEGFNSTIRRLQKVYTYNSAGQVWFSTLITPTIAGDPSNGGWFQVCLSNEQNDVYLGLANTDNQFVWSGGGERLYVEGMTGEKWAYSEFPVIDGEAAFLVMHLNFDEKRAYFYVNPDPSAEDPGPPVAWFQMLTDLVIDKARMWILNAGPSVGGDGADYFGSRVDEIRIGDTYQSVAAGANLTDPGGAVDTTPPVITGPSGAAGAATSSADVVEHTVSVATMSANEVVTWSINGGADGALFSIGGGTGGLSFRRFPDFELPLDSDGDNVYEVEIKARDSYDNFSTQTVMVTVTDSANWANLPSVVDGWVDTNAWGGTFLGRINNEKEPWIWVDTLKKHVYMREADVTNDGAWGLVPLSLEDTTPGDWAFWPVDANDNCLVDTGKSFLGPLNVCLAPWVFAGATDWFLYLPEEQVVPGQAWVFFTRIPGDPPQEQ